jgi:hypothetical protein
MNTTALKTAASLVDQIDALKTVRDQAAIIYQSGGSVVAVGIPAPIPGDTGNIAAQFAAAVQQSMAARLSDAFLAAADQAIGSLKTQLQRQIDLINTGTAATAQTADNPQQ